MYMSTYLYLQIYIPLLTLTFIKNIIHFDFLRGHIFDITLNTALANDSTLALL